MRFKYILSKYGTYNRYQTFLNDILLDDFLTNEKGKGVFRIDKSKNIRQTVGTCDFKMPLDTKKAKTKLKNLAKKYKEKFFESVDDYTFKNNGYGFFVIHAQLTNIIVIFRVCPNGDYWEKAYKLTLKDERFIYEENDGSLGFTIKVLNAYKWGTAA